jgi:hypothetical protein
LVFAAFVLIGWAASSALQQRGWLQAKPVVDGTELEKTDADGVAAKSPGKVKGERKYARKGAEPGEGKSLVSMEDGTVWD